jgi:predicted oxidoreductase
VVQSKCGIRWADDPPGTPQRFDFTREHILKSVEAILERLGTDRLDILLLHRPDPASDRQLSTDWNQLVALSVCGQNPKKHAVIRID